MDKLAVAVAVSLSAAVLGCGDDGGSGGGADGGTTGPCGTEEGLIAWYRMDETDPNDRVIDWTGNLQDGACEVPDRCPNPIEGVLGGGLDFDGSVVDRVSVQSSPNWQLTTGYTISLWFRARTANGPDLDTLIAKRLGDGSASSWRLGVRPADEGSAVLFGFAADGNLIEISGVALGEWAHLAATWTPEEGQVLYVDGNEAASNPGVADVGFDDGVILIGANPGPAAVEDPFDGAMDELRVYRGGLGQTEISALAGCGR